MIYLVKEIRKYETIVVKRFRSLKRAVELRDYLAERHRFHDGVYFRVDAARD